MSTGHSLEWATLLLTHIPLQHASCAPLRSMGLSALHTLFGLPQTQACLGILLCPSHRCLVPPVCIACMCAILLPLPSLRALPAHNRGTTACTQQGHHCLHTTGAPLPAHSRGTTACTQQGHHCLHTAGAPLPAHNRGTTACTQQGHHCLHTAGAPLPACTRGTTACTHQGHHCPHALGAGKAVCSAEGPVVLQGAFGNTARA